MTKKITVAPLSKAAIRGTITRFLMEKHRNVLQSAGAFPVLDYIDGDLLEQHFGFDAGVDEDIPDGILAYTDFGQRLVMLSQETYDGVHAGAGRARFSVAHEIGHLILHQDQLKDKALQQKGFVVNRGSSGVPVYMDPEWQADRAAAELLVPYRWLGAYRDPREIASRFGVSKQMAEIRTKENPAK